MKLNKSYGQADTSEFNSKNSKNEVIYLREQNELLNKQALLDAQSSQLRAQELGADLKMRTMEVEDLKAQLKNQKGDYHTPTRERDQQKQFGNMLLQKNEMNKVNSQLRQKVEEQQAQLKLQIDLYQEIKQQNQILSDQIEQFNVEIQHLQELLMNKDQELAHKIREQQRQIDIAHNHSQQEMKSLEKHIRNIEIDNEHLQKQLYMQRISFDEERERLNDNLRQKQEIIENLRLLIQGYQQSNQQSTKHLGHQSILQPSTKQLSHQQSFRVSQRKESLMSYDSENKDSQRHYSPKIFCTDSFMSNSSRDSEEQNSMHAENAPKKQYYLKDHNRTLNIGFPNNKENINKTAIDYSKTSRSSNRGIQY